MNYRTYMVMLAAPAMVLSAIADLDLNLPELNRKMVKKMQDTKANAIQARRNMNEYFGLNMNLIETLCSLTDSNIHTTADKMNVILSRMETLISQLNPSVMKLFTKEEIHSMEQTYIEVTGRYLVMRAMDEEFVTAEEKLFEKYPGILNRMEMLDRIMVEIYSGKGEK